MKAILQLVNENKGTGKSPGSEVMTQAILEQFKATERLVPGKTAYIVICTDGHGGLVAKDAKEAIIAAAALNTTGGACYYVPVALGTQ